MVDVMIVDDDGNALYKLMWLKNVGYIKMPCGKKDVTFCIEGKERKGMSSFSILLESILQESIRKKTLEISEELIKATFLDLKGLYKELGIRYIR